MCKSFGHHPLPIVPEGAATAHPGSLSGKQGCSLGESAKPVEISRQIPFVKDECVCSIEESRTRMLLKEERVEEDTEPPAEVHRGKGAPAQCPTLSDFGGGAPQEEWMGQHTPAGGAEELLPTHRPGLCVDQHSGSESVLKDEPQHQEASAGSVRDPCAEYVLLEGAGRSYSHREHGNLDLSYTTQQQRGSCSNTQPQETKRL
ncbi:hypothetical protein AGOR_G00195160 [Albula goreensis]|uniref:Uncharacterized protein n=1 Tax=Albula goreensis TaxID=1534307 RepID=A0A8T3CV31_9TELE|nr:hypothetical protein AGOR_G00195160 [Albula goreensis]